MKKYDPHAFLGLHGTVIRLWRPGATEIYLEVQGSIVQAHQTAEPGIFEVTVPVGLTYRDYKVYHTNGLLAHDPYAFLPTFGQIDEYLFSSGVHYKLYEAMGGRLATHQGVDGVKFAVWAPEAVQVGVIGDFNYWSVLANPMRSMGQTGVWELFVPGL